MCHICGIDVHMCQRAFGYSADENHTAFRPNVPAYPPIKPEYHVRDGRISLEVWQRSAEAEIITQCFTAVSHFLRTKVAAIERTYPNLEKELDNFPFSTGLLMRQMRIDRVSHTIHADVLEDFMAQLRGYPPELIEKLATDRQSLKPRARGQRAGRFALHSASRSTKPSTPEPHVAPIRFVGGNIDLLLDDLATARDLLTGRLDDNTIYDNNDPDLPHMEYPKLFSAHVDELAITTLITSLAARRLESATVFHDQPPY